MRNYFLYPLRAGSGDGGLFVCFVDSTVAVLGERKELERVISILHCEEASLLSNSDIAPLISRADSRSVIWGVLSAGRAHHEMQELVPLGLRAPYGRCFRSLSRLLRPPLHPSRR